jgi:hypothetical protein
MIGKKPTITIRVKLLSGLDKDLGLDDYDPDAGLILNVPNGTRIHKITRMLHLPDRHVLAYFVEGERAGLWRKLKNAQELACLRPSAGG